MRPSDTGRPRGKRGGKMKGIVVMTDSNSGIAPDEARALGVTVIPMPFVIDGETYLEGQTLSAERFYQLLEEGKSVQTSQPSPGELMAAWQEFAGADMDVVHIPMSSALSSSCMTARTLAEEFGGRVQVVDNRRIAVSQRQAVLDALALIRRGKSAREIRDILEAESDEASIYIAVDTLVYLKRGGRITPAAAAVGSILGIKPVLQIQGDKLDAFAKVRGRVQAKRVLLQALQKDIEERFAAQMAAGTLAIQTAYTGSAQMSDELHEALSELYPGVEIYSTALPLSIACHTGPGAFGVGCTKRLDVP